MCAGSSSTAGDILSCGIWWAMPQFPVSVLALQVMWTMVKHHGPGFSALSRLQIVSNETSFSFLGHMASSIFHVCLQGYLKLSQFSWWSS